VVIPVLNDQARIKDCLKAVFNQTLPPYEVIVVDGHSTDNTVKNALNFPVRVVFEDFGTVGGARQVGVEEAQGDYIAFTDSDCVPPIAAVGILLMAFIAPLISVAMLVVYALIVIGYTLAISTKSRKFGYLVSVPIVFILEHTAYMFGFWKGTIESVTAGSSS